MSFHVFKKTETSTQWHSKVEDLEVSIQTVEDIEYITVEHIILNLTITESGDKI